MDNIGVIGAGVVGLCTALNAQRAFPGVKVTVVADRFDEQTTSYGAGGLMRPSPDPDKPDYHVMRQCWLHSWQFASQVAHSEQAKEAGFNSVHLTAVYVQPCDKSVAFQRQLSYDFRDLSADDLRKRGFTNHRFGYSFTTFIIQTPLYLKWLMKQFLDGGGRIQSRKVHRLEELHGQFDLVFNCCGLGARLLAGDSDVTPAKGQVVFLKAPWMKKAYVVNQKTYIMPQQDRVAVGVTWEDGNDDTRVNPDATEDILSRVYQLLPELKGAQVLGTWAGVRPIRHTIRLEVQQVAVGPGQVLPVIHNYGHGAYGISLSWGTAVYAVSLARGVVANRKSRM